MSTVRKKYNIPKCTTGNDYVANDTPNISINVLSGNDTIKNSGRYAALNGGADNDYINNSGKASLSYIEGGEGNDTIYNNADNVTIAGGSGDDTISNIWWNNGNGNNVLIDGDDGDDFIHNNGSNVTINAGNGNDLMSLSGGSLHVIQYANGDGNDTIYGFDSADTIKISGAKYSTVKSGDDVKIIVGNGSMLLKDVEANGIRLNVQGTLSDDTVSTVETAKNITNAQSNTIIIGTKYADTISNSADSVTIDGGADNDYIKNSGNNVTIIGGDGKDTIVATSSALTLTDFRSEDVIALTDSIKSISFDENAKTLKLDDKIVISLPNINVIKSTWTTSDNSVTYNPAQLPEFTLSKNGKSITVAEGKATTPVTVSGLKNGLKVKDGAISGILLNNKTFTLSESVLDKKEVTVSNGYTLAFADDVNTPKKSEASWSVANGTATYKGGDTSAGYSVSNGKTFTAT